MANRIKNIDIRKSSYLNKYYVTTDVLDREDIRNAIGVLSVTPSSKEKICWLIEISRLYDRESVFDDLRALADKHAETVEECASTIEEATASEKPAKPLELKDEPEAAHPLSAQSLTIAVFKEMRKSLEKEVLDEYLKDSSQRNEEFQFLVHQQCPWTHAIITHNYQDTWHGYSKCNWPDTWDAKFGALLAVKRAARRFARQSYPG